MTKRTFQIYRYDPDTDAKPRMQTLEVELDGSERMLLDALIKLKAVDPTLSASAARCREGVCGSDAMNINGKNGLACLTNMRTLPGTVVLKPLPGLPVIRDLIVDMTQFFKQYDSIKPYLVNDTQPPEKERLQSPGRARRAQRPVRVHPVRQLLHQLPELLVEPRQVRRPGRPAAGLPLHRRQPRPGHRRRAWTTSKTRTACSAATRIMNCVDVCPKGLNPTKAIGKIKEMMVRRAV